MAELYFPETARYFLSRCVCGVCVCVVCSDRRHNATLRALCVYLKRFIQRRLVILFALLRKTAQM